ncbi:ATP-grasp domain-containing protein [Pedobacter sp. LMG 31464]|uniref:ATP-grasp domain-containing protein n=1 Tax=Pedobacter planticolens TaxID=2679964 RepID=A0A923DZE1_9SPHI|nr:ATP-grasp domain-containing protein [Pedobacter planticolens]MBB2145915.1 ATP-grasp domain-containing protein [Pedobacter planticolens]
MSKYNILITGTGGCGVGEGLYKSLKPLKDYNVFSCNSSDNSLYLFDDPTTSFIVPPASHHDYCKCLINICKTHQISVVLPGSEQELVVLVNNRNLFSLEGVVIFANTAEVINTYDNKWETFVSLKALNVKTPDTTIDIDDKSFFMRNSYPIIVKPIYGNASKNVFIVETKEELKCISAYLGFKKIDFVIQEYVGSAKEEYTISVLSDLSGNFLGSIVLKRILAGGFSQYIECESFDELDRIAQQVAKSVNSKGPLNIQCRIMNGELYVFEINPRFSGTSPFRALLGFNEADILFKKMFLDVNVFNRDKIQTGSFGVRGFQEKVYLKSIKSQLQINS